jgi:hypothetical protein
MFGEKGMIDLAKNKVHIRITVSPRSVIASVNANDTFSLSNVYMTASYYENFTGDLLKQLTFADFKSVQQYNPTTTQDLYLKLFTKNVDFVVGTILRTTNKTITNAMSADIVTTRFFEREGTPARISSWNFRVNNRPVFNYAPSVYEFVDSMRNILPNSFRHNVLLAPTNAAAYVTNSFVAGAKVGFTNAESQEMELTFSTTQGTASVACIPFMFAKIDNTITLN